MHGHMHGHMHARAWTHTHTHMRGHIHTHAWKHACTLKQKHTCDRDTDVDTHAHTTCVYTHARTDKLNIPFSA